MKKDDCPDPPYEGIVGICSLSIRKTDYIMRVLCDDGTAVDVRVGKLNDIPARKGDRVGVAVKRLVDGSCIAVFCRNLETQREFSWVPTSGCYIATMVFGYDSEEVVFLRSFRDKFLFQNLFGKIFVETYYKVSPKVVSLRGIDLLTPLIKSMLKMILMTLRLCMRGIA